MKNNITTHFFVQYKKILIYLFPLYRMKKKKNYTIGSCWGQNPTLIGPTGPNQRYWVLVSTGPKKLGPATTTQQPFRPQARGFADSLAWVCSQARRSGPSTQGMTALVSGVCNLGPNPLQHLELSVAGHGSPSTRCLQPGAYRDTKICTDCFFMNHLFNAKCIPMKRQSHPPLAIFATLCGKGISVITLLQSTVP